MKNVALIDGDIVIYEAIGASSRSFPVEDFTRADGAESLSAGIDLAGAKQFVERYVERACSGLGTTERRIALSSFGDRWRNAVMPTYKSNRSSAKPLGWLELRDWMVSDLGALDHKGLEADDLLGLWATGMFKDAGVIVSKDKDMNTLPCRWISAPGDEVVEVSLAEADAFHMKQALMGDAVDGYKGCPGYGAVTAAALVGKHFDSEADTFGAKECWAAIVAAYEKKGLEEADALQNARVARIVRDSDYDRKKDEVILWTPPSK